MCDAIKEKTKIKYKIERTNVLKCAGRFAVGHNCSNIAVTFALSGICISIRVCVCIVQLGLVIILIIAPVSGHIFRLQFKRAF